MSDKEHIAGWECQEDGALRTARHDSDLVCSTRTALFLSARDNTRVPIAVVLWLVRDDWGNPGGEPTHEDKSDG